MPKLNIIAKIPFKEVVTSIEIADIHGDGVQTLVMSTMGGDIRIIDFEDIESEEYDEKYKAHNLPPHSALALGDVNGDGAMDFVIGSLDNQLRVLSIIDGELNLRAETPVGTLPTGICITNLSGNPAEEVLVSSNDKALRCYGWFDGCLDKLAHKVVDMPVFSIVPLRSEGMPYNRFVFGDESANLYTYKYADDRLHELLRRETKGSIELVATGDITGNGTDEIVSVSEERYLGLYAIAKKGLDKFDGLTAPQEITSLYIGNLLPNTEGTGHLVVSHADSLITLFELDGRRLVQKASVKAMSKCVDSMVSCGDLSGDGRIEIAQAAGHHVSIIQIEDD